MAPASNEEQFKFLISCIRYSNNGKVDFSQVAKECKIVSKGAAAKRYERMMRAHGIGPNAATVKPTPRSLKSDRTDFTSSSSSPATKKRKTDPLLEDNTATDDDEGFGTVKSEPVVTKTEEASIIKEETEQKPQPGQLSLDEAANLLQYYNTPSQYAGVGMGMNDGYNVDYAAASTYGSSISAPSMAGSDIGALHGMDSQHPYGFSSPISYGSTGMGGIYSGQSQMSYQPVMQYSSEGEGRADSPVIVE